MSVSGNTVAKAEHSEFKREREKHRQRDNQRDSQTERQIDGYSVYELFGYNCTFSKSAAIYCNPVI